MDANQIIIIQTSVVGGMEAASYLDEFGLERDKHYVFFPFFYDPAVEANIRTGVPQLIFTSHGYHHLPGDIAKRIKKINPQAIVFAFTSNHVNDIPSELDGVIQKYAVPKSFIANLSKAFIAGAGRNPIVEMVKELEK